MKNKKLYILFVLLAGLQLWFTFVTFHFPYLGIYVEKNNENQWIIQKFEPNVNYVSLGLQIGDTIISIDDQAPDHHLTVKNFAAIEQAHKISVLRDGSIIEVNTYKKNKSDNGYYYTLIGEIISLCIALIMYLNSSGSKSARFLSFLFLMVGVAFMSLGTSPRGDFIAKVLLGNIVMALPFVFLQFLIIFFKEKGNIHLPSRYIYYYYGLIGLITLPSILYATPYPAYQYFRLYYKFILLSFTLGSLLVFAFIISFYFKYHREKTYFSSVIKIIWFAFILSFLPLALFTFLPEILFKKDIISPYITAYCTLFFPLTFCYLLISKKLFDIHLILRRIISTTIISLIPSLIITGLLLLIFQEDFSLGRGLFSFLFILTIISVLLYSLEYLMTYVEVVLFPRKYYLQTSLKKISTEMSSIKNFRDLKNMILVDIVKTLQIIGGAIVFQYENEIEIIDEGEIDHSKLKKLAADPENSTDYFIYEINRHEDYTSYLVLTPKKNNLIFHKEEIQWLKLIMSNLSVSLENLYLIRKQTQRLYELVSHMSTEKENSNVIWFRKSMFDLQEKERVRIASDIHDTTMQDIFFIQRKLQTLKKQTLGELDKKQLSDIIYHLDIVNITLRQNCFELNPPILESVGFLKTIENLIEIENGLSLFELNFFTDDDHRIEKLDLESKRHLFRIVQELLNNAKKHSRAKRVTISCTSNEECFYLEYQDDGIGFELQNLDSEQIMHSGVGLEQMKSRVLEIKGTIDIQSSKDKGMKVEIGILLKEGMTA
jgi:two-component system, NarL family, sensor histidine kinase ComP